MNRSPIPNYGDFQEENGQLKWWGGKEWLFVIQPYDRDATIKDLCERVAQLEARLDKQDEYLQEQGER